MALFTRSVFYYGHEVTQNNRIIPFNEGSGELNAYMRITTYSLENYAQEMARAMTEVGTQVYSVTIDRATRKLTISATSNFDILFSTSLTSTVSARELSGFGDNDYTGSNSYEGINGSGFEYKPQFKLQSYVDFQDNIEANESKVNVSATGITEVVSFGRTEIMECNITYATNIEQSVKYGNIENNPSGVEDLRHFLNYIIGKGDIEFMPDRDDADTFTTCFLERTKKSQDGTGFNLSELTGRNLTGYFETGKISFRKVDR
jgi:hypothetical protein